MMSFDDMPPAHPKRQRALSFEEIEEEYEERSKRVPFHFSDEDSDSASSDNENGADDSFSMDEISPRFNIERVLGKGSYGLVVRATDPLNHRTVAVKRLKHVFDTSEVAQRVLNEIRLLKALGVHPNVTSLHALLRDVSASEDTFNTVYMVLEAAHSDLFKILNSTIVLKSQQVKSIIHQTLTALSWLHSCNVIHCDVKPANLLVDADCRIRLADFGLSRWSVKNSQAQGGQDTKDSASVVPTAAVKGHRFLRVESLVGDDETYSDEVALECCYRSPEVLWPFNDSEPYRASLDVWSVGCVFAELLIAMKDDTSPSQTSSVSTPSEPNPSSNPSPSECLPLDSTGRVLGGHRHRPPLFALKEPPPWLNLVNVSTVPQPSSQETAEWSKSPNTQLANGRRSRSPRPELLHVFSSDSRRVLGSFLHVLGTEALNEKGSLNINYLSAAARMFVTSSFEHMKPQVDMDCDESSLKLLRELLLLPPHLRPSAEAALDNKYFTGMKKTPLPTELVSLPPPSISRWLLRKEMWSEIDGDINKPSSH